MNRKQMAALHTRLASKQLSTADLTAEANIPMIEGVSEEKDTEANDAILAAEAEEEENEILVAETEDDLDWETGASLQLSREELRDAAAEDDCMAKPRARRKRHYVSTGPVELLYVDMQSSGMSEELNAKYASIQGPFRTKRLAEIQLDLLRIHLSDK